MIGSRSCSNHENRCVDCTRSSGIALLCIRGDRLPAVRSEGADADRARRPVRHSIGSVALRPGGRRAANRWRCTVACESLRSAGTNDSRPDHREYFLVSPAPLSYGCGDSDRRRDFVVHRGVLSPPIFRRPLRAGISVAHRTERSGHARSEASLLLPDTPTYPYTPRSIAAHQRDSASAPRRPKKSFETPLATTL